MWLAKPGPRMKLRGGPGVFFKARDRRPGDRGAEFWSDLSRVSEMHDHLTAHRQVLERLDEKYQPFARKLKFCKGWFVEDKDGR